MNASFSCTRRAQCGAIGAKLEAQIADEISPLVADHPGTFQAFQGGLGLLVAEGCGLLVIDLGGGGILRSAAPALGKGAHALERPGVTLRGGLVEQRPRRRVVLRPPTPSAIINPSRYCASA